MLLTRYGQGTHFQFLTMPRALKIGIARHTVSRRGRMAARCTMSHILLIIAFTMVGIPTVLYLFWITHIQLDRLCIKHARRFCIRSGLEFRRARWQPEFDSPGIKTEFTLVQIDCFNLEKQRRLILLSVWPFGVRKTISNEPYPDDDDSQWPQVCEQ